MDQGFHSIDRRLRDGGDAWSRACAAELDRRVQEALEGGGEVARLQARVERLERVLEHDRARAHRQEEVLRRLTSAARRAGQRI